MYKSASGCKFFCLQFQPLLMCADLSGLGPCEGLSIPKLTASKLATNEVEHCHMR